jgi:hypothetical protein
MEEQQSQQTTKKGISIGAAIVLGISGIIIAAIIAAAILVSKGINTVKDFDFESLDGLEFQVDDNGEKTKVNVEVNESSTTDSILDIPLTQTGVDEALSTWKSVETVERGGRFAVPHDWIVTKINEGGQVLWKIDTSAGVSLESFATAGNRDFSIQKYGEPNSCYGGDPANALCVYGDNPELLHYGSIVGWY